MRARWDGREGGELGREVTAFAPAKVNLTLGVGARGGDGYHPLCTVFQAVDLYERVTARWREQPGVGITVAGVGADRGPLDATNLAARAAEALAAYADLDVAVDIHIDKAIPVAGGLAGGSADAAATLLACDALWGTDLSPEELAELALGLGADVPFALVGGTALGRGRGEQLEPLAVGAPMWWVLVTRPHGLSTREIFAAWDRNWAKTQQLDETRLLAGGVGLVPPAALTDALADGDVPTVGQHLANDLQPCAQAAMPELREVLALAVRAGALGAVVSGSGPTVAALTSSRESAGEVAVSLRDSASGVEVLVVKAIPTGTYVDRTR